MRGKLPPALAMSSVALDSLIQSKVLDGAVPRPTLDSGAHAAG